MFYFFDGIMNLISIVSFSQYYAFIEVKHNGLHFLQSVCDKYMYNYQF